MLAETEKPKVLNLTPAQQAAVVPDANVWLSASAGSGKTQVLSARVIRLLLAGAKPEEILCLTFTKAAAAEMAERINRKLAAWVQMLDADLARELLAIGADHARAGLPKARKLFAEILDAPGGGLQIMTIHSFCQSLLGSFPEEAGIMPGFEPLDERTKAELQREVLAQIAHEADETGDLRVAESLHRLGFDRGEDGAWAFLQRCAGAVATLRQLPEDQGLVPFVRRQLDLGFEGSVDELMRSLCDDDVIDLSSIRSAMAANKNWGSERGLKRAETIANWLALPPLERGQSLAKLHGCWSKNDGEPLVASKGFTPPDESYARIALDLYHWGKRLTDMKALSVYADRLADGLLAGRAFALRYAETKRARGLVDFDDLIAKAAELLTKGGMTQWVRYKLDRRIDHILVDEAQDTNAEQWAIIEALSDDFFAGEGAKGEKPRTIFAVGDFKQAIYGFQGTDPARYREAEERYAARLAEQKKILHRLTLSQSFRSTQPILRLVNALIDTQGHQRFGLTGAIDEHVSDKPDIGSVELIEPVTTATVAEEGEGDEEKWLGPEKRALAAMLAQKIKAIIDERPVLASSGKPLKPGDIMVLFRKRTEVASLLVARLHALKVPVAGIDRMQLGEQLAVQDLISAIRFALQPEDDLSLACLLVSPLIGWSQERLLEHGYRAEGVQLWRHLRRHNDIAGELTPLDEMLNSADFTTPYQFIEQILSGPTQGRKKFAARLGEEVLVPIEELLNLAIEFEQSRGGTLQQFLDWFERSSSEIKRERLTGSDEVQIMTVHGAKGLQAPVVILADMTVDPGACGSRDPNSVLPIDFGGEIPLLRIDKEARLGRLAELEDLRVASELNEHYRLLYVALTRAEERLIMAGSLGSRQKEPKPDSWYHAVAAALDHTGAAQDRDDDGRAIRRLVGGAGRSAKEVNNASAPKPKLPGELPIWLLQPASPEARPPRPLAPSQLDDADAGDRPASAALRLAAERGKLIHGLIERVDGSRLDRFEADARRWLAARDSEGRHDHEWIISQVQTLLCDRRWQALFSAKARAEVPIAAVVGETVVAGRIDRLLVDDEYIRIVDFKTSRRVPVNAAEINLSELRQMAHYVAAIERIFPDQKVSAALLYTHAPLMVELTDADLAPYRPV
jgi:ATP-dependent helicase/nuclease subunit A